MISATRFLFLAESLAPARTKRQIRAIEHAGLFVVEVEALAALMEIGDAGEQLGIEIDRRIVRGELRREIAFDGL